MGRQHYQTLGELEDDDDAPSLAWATEPENEIKPDTSLSHSSRGAGGISSNPLSFGSSISRPQGPRTRRSKIMPKLRKMMGRSSSSSFNRSSRASSGRAGRIPSRGRHSRVEQQGLRMDNPISILKSMLKADSKTGLTTQGTGIDRQHHVLESLRLLSKYMFHIQQDGNALHRFMQTLKSVGLPSLKHALEQAWHMAPDVVLFLVSQLVLLATLEDTASQGQLETWIVKRCRSDLHFSLRCAWTVKAYKPIDTISEPGQPSCLSCCIPWSTPRLPSTLGGSAFHDYISSVFSRMQGPAASFPSVSSSSISTGVSNRLQDHDSRGRVSSATSSFLSAMNWRKHAGASLQQEEAAWWQAGNPYLDALRGSLEFADSLVEISQDLACLPRGERQSSLEQKLEHLNQMLPMVAVLPTLGSSKAGVLLRLSISESRVLSTRARAPYIVYFEYMPSDRSWTPENISYLNQTVTQLKQHSNTTIHTESVLLASEPNIIQNSASTDNGPPVSGSVQKMTDSSAGSSSTDAEDRTGFQAGKHEEQQRAERCRKESPWCNVDGWQMVGAVIKANDDLRQEQLAVQLIDVMQSALEVEGVGAYLRPYSIVPINDNAGLIEAVPAAHSLHSIKSQFSGEDLLHCFKHVFENSSSISYERAVENFVCSMAGYSVVTYILNLKDRHNGNILLDGDGRIIHVDFGFMLSNSPGGVNFEKAPFKLTSEMVQVMGGVQSPSFAKFRRLVVEAFMAIRSHYESLLPLIELQLQACPELPCFAAGPRVISDLCARLRLHSSDDSCRSFIHSCVSNSINSIFTKSYDRFQTFTNGII